MEETLLILFGSLLVLPWIFFIFIALPITLIKSCFEKEEPKNYLEKYFIEELKDKIKTQTQIY